MSAIRGGRIAGTSSATTITVAEGLIAGIGGEAGDDDGLDAEGLTVSPGLIDLQINGAFGHDFTSDPASMWHVGPRLPEHGVTAFLPTLVTSPPDIVEAAIEALSTRPPGYRGAEPLGLHLEGPMISPRRPGIHDTDLVRLPASTPVEAWSRERGIALLTLAPELAGAGAAVESLIEAGVVVSAGHTAADYDRAMEGFRWGIGLVTHLFNAMEPFRHREPGLIGAALDSDHVIVTLIVDGIHSHPSAVRAAWTLFGPDRLALVTDAMAASGLGDGHYQIGAQSLDVVAGRPTDSTGRLAGSTLTLDEAMRNLVELTGCHPDQASAAASSVPARALGLGDRGNVEVGARADLTLLDNGARVVATMVGGEIVWQS